MSTGNRDGTTVCVSIVVGGKRKYAPTLVIQELSLGKVPVLL